MLSSNAPVYKDKGTGNLWAMGQNDMPYLFHLDRDEWMNSSLNPAEFYRRVGCGRFVSVGMKAGDSRSVMFELCLLGMGDAFLINGVRYEKVDEWSTDIPVKTRCLNVESGEYVSLDSLTVVKVVK